MVVEDDDAIRDAVCELLRDESFEVLGAADLGAAREALVAWKPEVIVLDHLLGDGCSDDLLEELADVEGSPRVVLVSGSSRAPAAAWRYSIPCVFKPFDFERLLGALEEARRPTLP